MSNHETDPWDEAAADWDRDEGPRRYASAAYSSLITELGGRNLELTGMRVLDFGAGTGLLTELIEPVAASILAVDTSPGMRARLSAKATAWPTVDVADRLPDSGEPFDLVVASSVLGFVDDYPATTSRLVGLLRPGGLFVQWDWERADPDEDHGLERGQISDVLTAAGLEEVTVTSGFVIEIEDARMEPVMGSGIRPDER